MFIVVHIACVVYEVNVILLVIAVIWRLWFYWKQICTTVCYPKQTTPTDVNALIFRLMKTPHWAWNFLCLPFLLGESTGGNPVWGSRTRRYDACETSKRRKLNLCFYLCSIGSLRENNCFAWISSAHWLHRLRCQSIHRQCDATKNVCVWVLYNVQDEFLFTSQSPSNTFQMTQMTFF